MPRGPQVCKVRVWKLKTSEQVGTCADQLLITGGSPQSYFYEILGLFRFPIFPGLLGVMLNKLI